MTTKKQTDQQQQTEDPTIKEWLDSLGSVEDYEIRVSRLSPTRDEHGNDIKGYLDNVDELNELNEDYLKNRWGGGKYQIKILSRDGKGRISYNKSTTVAISGPPKITYSNSGSNGVSQTVHEDPKIASQAMEMMERSSRAERDRAEKLEQMLQNPKNDGMLDLLREQLSQSRDYIQRLENKMDKMAQGNPQQDRILEIIAGGKNTELASLRENHRSEMEALRNNYEGQIQRQADYHQRDMQALREDHKRMMDSIERTYESRIQSSETSYKGQITLLQTQLENAKSDIKRMTNEIEKLRNEKQKSIGDSAKELLSIKEMLSSFDDGGGDDKDTWEKILDKGSDALGQLVGAVQQRSAQHQMAQQVQQQQVAQAQEQRQLQQAEQNQKLSQEEALQALQYAESAINNNVDPQRFAQSAQSTFSPLILEKLLEDGPDQFADMVKQINPGSVLSKQKGRLFLRKVAEALQPSQTPGESAGE